MLFIRSSLQKKFDFNESARELVLVKGNFRVSDTSSFCLEAASIRTNIYKLHSKTSVLNLKQRQTLNVYHVLKSHQELTCSARLCLPLPAHFYAIPRKRPASLWLCKVNEYWGQFLPGTSSVVKKPCAFAFLWNCSATETKTMLH